MPELPEVTIIANSLDKKLRGLILAGVEYDWPKKFFWGRFSIADLKGSRVEKVERMGKIVVIGVTRLLGSSVTGKKNLPSNQVAQKPSNLSILIHLKLTGQLIYEDAKTRIAGGHPIPPLNLPSPNKTTRATFSFTNKGKLYFNDMRKFGWVKVVASEESKVKEAIGKELGPDALEVSLKDFIERIKKKPNATIKKLLMDQSFISGVGNIYSDEGLWLAKIHPKRPVVSLSDNDLKAVLEGIRNAMKLAIEKGGSSANSFVGSGGERGLYLSYAVAYHMTGKPCARCGILIVREKMDGRSAHYCPACQKLK